MTETLLATSPAPLPLTAGGHTFRMIPVRGGVFDMGDEAGDLWGACSPVHSVKLGDFCIGQFPVTQALWREVCLTPALSKGEGESLDPDPSYFKGDRRPVESVSWDDVQVFLEKLNRLLPGRDFRLPTEAEWEYAARGDRSDGVTASHPVTTRYAGSNRLDSVGWWDGNSHGETKPVGLKLPNPLGLFDMSGNVWEWCADWYDGKYYEKCVAKGTVENPRNDEKGSARVLRGGSWLSVPLGCRVANRNYDDPDARGISGGFRLAASPSSQWR